MEEEDLNMRKDEGLVTYTIKIDKNIPTEGDYGYKNKTLYEQTVLNISMKALIAKFKEANYFANLLEYSDRNPEALEDKARHIREFTEVDEKLDEHVATYVNKYVKF